MSNNSVSSAVRTLNYPIDHIVSELIAFPLASVAAFENNITELDPKIEDHSTNLWRSAEKAILRAVPDLSIDFILAIRDLYWFDQPGRGKQTLVDYLRRTANNFFSVCGQDAFIENGFGYDRGENKIRESEQPLQRSRSLRWLSFSLPLDLMLGALDGELGPPSDTPDISPILFKHMEEHGFSENHLHLGASLHFRDYWVVTLRSLASIDSNSEAKKDMFQSPGAEFDEGRQLAPWLLRTAITRYLLAAFMKEPSTKKTFDAYFYKDILPEVLKRQGLTTASDLATAVEELVAGVFSDTQPSFSDLRYIYRDIAGIRESSLPSDSRPFQAFDPIAGLISPNSHFHGPTPEIYFLKKGISYLHQRNCQSPEDPFFEALFWQTIRMRNIFYRHIVQRPMTPGLKWFVRMYTRLSPGKRAANKSKQLLRFAFNASGGDNGLKSLEIRTSPEKSSSENLELVNAVNHVLNEKKADSSYRSDFEIGLVLHFTRLRDPKDRAYGTPKAFWQDSVMDPGTDSEFRYARFYKEKRQEAHAFARLLYNFPSSLYIVRGIDLCTDELAVPAWVTAPLIRFVKKAGQAASAYLKGCTGKDVPELKISVHTGEDFVHLLGGLRRVDEAMTCLDLDTGDRMGHGLPLGTDPEEWAKRNSMVCMQIEDRLFDLIWEWSLYSTGQVPPADHRLVFIESEILRLGEIIFQSSIKVRKLAQLYRNLSDFDLLKSLSFPDHDLCNTPNCRNEDKKDFKQRQTGLLYQYLSDPRVFQNGCKLEWVRTGNELKSMQLLQGYIRNRIAQRGIVIEVNPTSNLLIGNLADLNNHPLWRLSPPHESGNVPPVSVCIGSDDPTTFATNLRKEYSLLRENLLVGGLSNKEACEYLDRIRVTGLNSRFTLGIKDSDFSPLDWAAFGIEETDYLI